MSTQISDLHASIGADLSGFNRGLDQAESRLDSFGKGITQGIGISIGMSFMEIGRQAGQAAQYVVGMAMDYESAFAGVRKTVDATEEEFAQLSAGLRELATSADSPVSSLQNAQVELANIAAIAGQLGVEKENLLAFTETIGMLGMSTNLMGEQAAMALAQFANITQMDMSNVDRLGATIVALGNNLATTEADIVEFAQRLAGAGDAAGLSEAEILSLGAAMASVGLNAEAGGTAMTQVFGEIGKAAALGGDKLNTFARLADMSAADFATAWKNEPMEALTDFLAGLGELEAADQLMVLEELGLDGIRTADTLRRLAGNVDLVTEAITIGNSGWEENTALVDEAGKRAETTAAQWLRFKNNLNDLAITIGGAVLPALNDLLEVGSGVADFLGDVIGVDLGFEVTGDAPDIAAEAARMIGPEPPPIDVVQAVNVKIEPGEIPWNVWQSEFSDVMSWETFSSHFSSAASAAGLTNVQASQNGITFDVEIEAQLEGSVQTTRTFEDLEASMYRVAEAQAEVEKNNTGIERLNEEVTKTTGMAADFGLAVGFFEKLADMAVPDGLGEALGDIADAMGRINIQGFAQTGDPIYLIGESWREVAELLPALTNAMVAKILVGWLDLKIGAADTVNSIIDSFNSLGPDLLKEAGIDITVDKIDTSEWEAAKQQIIDERLTPEVVIEDNGIDDMLAAFSGEPMTIAVNATGLDELAVNLDAITMMTGEPLSFTVGGDSYTSVNAFEAAIQAGTYDKVTTPLVVTISQGSFDNVGFMGNTIDSSILAKDDAPMSFQITSNAAAVGAEIDAAARDRFAEITFRIRELGGDIADALPGFADGGSVMGGNPIIVGEEGPELFVPGSDGEIIPNDALSVVPSFSGGGGGAGGAQIVIQNLILPGVRNPDDFYDEMETIKRQRA
jgi:TP901 family phage tail tape measure protein